MRLVTCCVRYATVPITYFFCPEVRLRLEVRFARLASRSPEMSLLLAAAAEDAGEWPFKPEAAP